MRNNCIFTYFVLVFTILSFGQAPLLEVNVAPVLPLNLGDCTSLTASFPTLSQTTNYTPLPITYSPSFPFTGGTLINAVTDDVYSPIVNLPFTFTFYGAPYNNLLVGSNGVVTFNLTDAGGFCPWAFTASAPSPTLPLNSIYCVYQDTNITSPPVTNPAIQNVNYYVLDTGVNAPPNRVFVANWNQLPQYGDASGASGLQTSQLVLHEGTNIIEFIVDRRDSHIPWNNGNGVIGVQNAVGTAGVVAPGYQTGPWDADNIAFQFTPSGAGVVASQLQWSVGGVPVGAINENPLNVCPTVSTTYTATVTYTNVNGTTFSVSTDVTVDVAPPLPLVSPVDITICSISGAPYTADINQHALMLSSVPVADQANYSIKYYEDATDAANDASNNINFGTETSFTTLFTFSTPPPKTIYVRLESIITEFFNVRSFNINVQSAPSGTFSYATAYCDNDPSINLPTLSSLSGGGIFSATPVGLSIYPFTGAIDGFGSLPGTYSVTYDVAATASCPAYSSTATVTIEACSCTIIASSTSQTVCVNTLITPITYTSSAIAAIFGSVPSADLPTGITGVFAGNTFIISGTPTTPGVYTFSVTLETGTSDICSIATTIVVNAQPNAGLDGSTTICDSSFAPIDLFSLIIGEQTGGTWTRVIGTGGIFDAISGTYTPALGATNSVFEYRIAGVAPCVDDFSIATINVNQQLDAGIDGCVSVSDESANVINLFGLLAGGQTGGSWTRTSGAGGTFSAVVGTYVPSIGATTSTFTYTVSAATPCISDSSVCTVIINGAPCGSLSVSNFDTSLFEYSPNPFSDILKIKFAQPINNIQIFNLLGQQVFMHDFREKEIQINLFYLSSGTYLVKAKTADSLRTFKIVKN